MTQEAPSYDLMILLSTSASEEQRAKILADVERAIPAGGGSIERNGDWGTRPLAYRIDHQLEADYHLLQISGPPSLLESLSQTLRITDGVVRFRIIKVLPGTPPPPGPSPAMAPAHAPPVPDSEPEGD